MPRILSSRITPELVGQYLGLSAQSVREAMDSGALKIGRVNTTEGGQKQYLILPKPLYEETGIKLNGYEPPPVIRTDLDHELLAKEIVREYMEKLKNIADD